MAPTKHKLEKTKVGEEVLDLVIPYIHDVEDRSSVSLVSRKFYEIDGITRKRLTVHTLYYPNPASLSKRFPFIESLTLKGRPSVFKYSYEYVNRIAPWIQQLALEFKFLKELHIHRLAVNDEDLETLARTRGKDLTTLKIKKCKGYSSYGLRHISKYCNQLRTLSLGYSEDIEGNDGIWLHEFALNNTVLEMFKFKNTDLSHTEDLTLLAKNCCNSLISLKIAMCDLSKLGDAFRYAVRLEHFSGDHCDDESDFVGFEFLQHMCSISIDTLLVTRCSIVFPFLNRIRKLKLAYLDMNEYCQCLLFTRCPNLEVLYTEDGCGDTGLQVIGQFCKKLRKLTHYGGVTHVGLISLGKGCTNLESLKVGFGDTISNEALECVGTHLKNLRDFCILLRKEDDMKILPLDCGIRTMLMGCSKLKRLNITFCNGSLTDVGLVYIGSYGANLRSLALECQGNSNTGLVTLSNAGLVKLSQGCQKLRKLKLIGCPFIKQVVTSSVFNIPSLRYVWLDNTVLVIRPEFQL